MAFSSCHSVSLRGDHDNRECVVSDAAPCSPTADASLKSKEREKDRQIYGKGESITSGDRCRASLPVLDRLFGMGRKPSGQTPCQQLPRVCIGACCNNTVYTIDKAVKMTAVKFGLIHLLKLVQHDYPTPTATSIRPAEIWKGRTV